MWAIAMAVFLLVAVAGGAFGATGDSAVGSLVEKLVEKGVIDKEDARELGAFPDEEESAAAAPELPFEIELRMQTRFDAGDLLVDSEGEYETESDLFLRRVRLEVEKEFENLPIGQELELNLTFDADRAEQDFRGGEREDPSNRADLQYIYADWTIVGAFALKVGKHKLPFSRVSLTSSARQLLIERPASTELAKDSLGDYQQAQVQLHGDFLDDAIRYYLAYADGANNLDTLEDLDSEADAVRERRWGNAYLGRIEISPLGFTGIPRLIEKRRDDTGIGDENHLTLGINAGIQDDIRYTTDSVEDASLGTRLFGADLGGRYRLGTMGTLTGQAEYVTFKRDFNYRDDEEPDGYYGQLGYLLPATILRGWLEPALRYEVFDRDRIETEGERGTKERTFTAGFNHYLAKHQLKWSYNFVHTRFDDGVAEAVNDGTRNLHEVLLQLAY
jgi:phosphate-selective porin OprO/OprP